MGRIRGWVKRLEREARGELVEIPQRDGAARRFPQSELAVAYINLMERLGAGEDAPPEHPVLVAARNSSDPYWSESLYAEDPHEWTKPVPELFE
jgi:hypothetical protein